MKLQCVTIVITTLHCPIVSITPLLLICPMSFASETDVDNHVLAYVCTIQLPIYWRGEEAKAIVRFRGT